MAANCVSVFGAGSWGTALAILLSQGQRPAVLWGHNPDHQAALAGARCNEGYLPGIAFPDSLRIEADIATAVTASPLLLIAVPSHVFRETLKRIRPFLQAGQKIAWASKGLEPDTHQLLHTIAEQELGEQYPLAVVSGPTFAREVASGLPTAVTVSSRDSAFAEQLAARLHTETFRAYTGTDVVGVEIGGAVKNVLAIAAGIADGLGFGANTRAALITRGLAEMSRLGQRLGADADTFMGLAGLGDLVLTCTDDQSRNRRFGKAIAAGNSAEQAFTDIGQVVEGAKTARVLHELAASAGVDMPISEQVYQVIYANHDPHKAVRDLLQREQKAE
ncbi:NAD(P)H-dependent glycerol-3-phosphate dehydrogenase [Sulfuriflexus sp.]|uniref:NAD(P)H-dependent glycerol-3-phosphate dehydrogenase n=1 Tax=Sulfuriflexus sp. TaxID=2015443 RepID=UPI0028CDEEE8|nr:NAD(P)H-dependent glycerol-3-phosphate dehydrogenase [Sulfuriflexus sp.]MDT8404420.1 NAD(P)H-dependent glycerol-3-phosphate dehydrogenase [Sulfuriflexus sp.]